MVAAYGGGHHSTRHQYILMSDCIKSSSSFFDIPEGNSMNFKKQWEDFLTPEITQERLITASLYITAFEMLKESIIGRIRDFYCIGFSPNELEYSSKYKDEVLSLNTSPLYASLKWLIGSEAIHEEDLSTFEKLKNLRNTLAHELPEVVFTGKNLSVTEHMKILMDLLRKIEVWWVLNVEIPTNPDFDGSEVDPELISPGPILMMHMMFEVIAGKSELLEVYRNAGKK